MFMYFTTLPHQTSKKTKNEVANLILLFHELMSHEVFSHGQGKDETTKQVRKLTKEILKVFSKRLSYDVAEGGKIKKHHKSAR